jgi:Transposase DDE domain group 1
MAWCEKHTVDYVFGLARNARLRRKIAAELRQAKQEHQRTAKATWVFAEFSYRTPKSWSRRRRVVAKAEYLDKGENPRFVVTSLKAQGRPAQKLYEQLYCARGEMENRIKEQLSLFSDRLSTETMRQSAVVVLLAAGLRVDVRRGSWRWPERSGPAHRWQPSACAC